MNKQDRHMFNRLLENDLSPEDRAQALQKLEKDPEAIRYLAQQAVFLSELNEWLSCQNMRDTMVSKGFRPHATHAMKKKQWWFGVENPRRLLAGVAAVIMLAIGGLFLVNELKHDGRVVAEIVETDADLSHALWPVGQSKVVQEIKFDSGRMRLRLKNGVKISLEGPVHATFVSAMQLRLMKGKAMADVGKDGKGFVIETVNARVVDLGTSFGVSVGESNATDIVVFEGSVEIYDPTNSKIESQSKLTLIEGEAVRMDNSRNLHRVPMIAMSRVNQDMQATTASDFISDVMDNVVTNGVNRFYGLVRKGMQEGARVYTTGHTRTWHPLSGETFPQELVGADVIRTISSDRQQEDLSITLVINKPCELYVFPDARYPVPEWVRRDYTNTGFRLLSGPWIPRGKTLETLSVSERAVAYVPHSVWKKIINQTGPVILGTALPGEHVYVRAMYGLAVKELSL